MTTEKPGLTPEWEERLRGHGPSPAPPPPMPTPPLSRAYLAGEVRLVRDAEAADILARACHESPVSWIGIDAEFRYESALPLYVHGASGRNPREVWDIRAIRPFCLGLAAVSGDALFLFVVDLRVTEVLESLRRVLELPVPFVAHSARAELFVLRSLGLPEPRILWDTLIAQRALELGRHPTRVSPGGGGEPCDEISSQERAAREREGRLSLSGVLRTHSLVHPSAGAKGGLQRAFLTKPFDEPLTPEEVAYCAADARSVAELYPFQRLACDREGIAQTLDRVVMPWAATAAEIELNGVHFDRDRCREFLLASAGARGKIESGLRGHGIANPGSPCQVAGFLRSSGLDRHFPRTKKGQPSTEDRVLKQRQHLHPAIRAVRAWRKLGQLSNDPAVRGLLTASDGRVHASLCVLGSDTGRTQSQLPNLMGLGRDFRPLIRAPAGRGIGEVDLAQIEVGVAAALFGDGRLIEDYNAGDVYAAMAKRIFRSDLTDADLSLDAKAFKSRHGRLRDRTKPLVLGIIYGETVHGIARDLVVSVPDARRLWDAFREQYPALCRGMEESREQAARRGYAYIDGLRRYRAAGGRAGEAELRSLGNAAVQGAAALVFFDAGNRLRRLLREHDARLILPVHDAYVFEAPLATLAAAADTVRRALISSVQERFPELRPRADVNIRRPECWNDEGRHDSVERFLEDPLGRP